MTRVGLVLGGGGAVGQAHHAGVLAALEHDLGWDPRTADVIVGTSVGSITGTLKAPASPTRARSIRSAVTTVTLRPSPAPTCAVTAATMASSPEPGAWSVCTRPSTPAG